MEKVPIARVVATLRLGRTSGRRRAAGGVRGLRPPLVQVESENFVVTTAGNISPFDRVGSRPDGACAGRLPKGVTPPRSHSCRPANGHRCRRDYRSARQGRSVACTSAPHGHRIGLRRGGVRGGDLHLDDVGPHRQVDLKGVRAGGDRIGEGRVACVEIRDGRRSPFVVGVTVMRDTAFPTNAV